MRGLRRRARGTDRDAGDAVGGVKDAGAGAGTRDGGAADGHGADGGPGADGVAGTGTDAAEDSGGGVTSGRRRIASRMFPLASGIVIVVLVVVMGLLLWQRYGTDDTASAGDGTLASPAIDVAEQVVMGITNINPDTVESNADTVLSHSTGAFHDDYEAAQGQFATLVGEADANSTGHIVQSGLESIGGDTATVLVVVSTDVQNKALPEASQRGYRLRVTLEKEGDSYKVSNLEQVP